VASRRSTQWGMKMEDEESDKEGTGRGRDSDKRGVRVGRESVSVDARLRGQ